MAAKRKLYLNAVMFGLGNHEAAWRMPESPPGASTSLPHWLNIARIAEDAGFNSLFLGDVLALLNEPSRHLSDTLDPLVVLSAIAATTERIGMIGTASTSFDKPFHIARRFASLDHISNGRAGWNIVTSSNVREARNFGLPEIPNHALRYARAGDFVDAVCALWDSWGRSARICDKEAGLYLDEAQVHDVNHDGPFVKTAGPLNTPRPPQGRPLLVQAGSSPDGRALAASCADVVFTAQKSLSDAVDFYGDIKARAKAAGRDPSKVLVMPGIMPVVAQTREAAQERMEAIDRMIVLDHAMAQLSEYLRIDASTLDLDAPLPDDISPDRKSELNQSRLELLIGIAKDEGLTVRQLLVRVGGGRGHFIKTGTASDIADTLQEWHEAGAADGFNVMCPVLPGDLAAFAEMVIPELISRGIFEKAAGNKTLRESYGLPNL